MGTQYLSVSFVFLQVESYLKYEPQFSHKFFFFLKIKWKEKPVKENTEWLGAGEIKEHTQSWHQHFSQLLQMILVCSEC